MTFTHSFWLILALPALFLLRAYPSGTKWMMGLRCIGLGLLILALAEPSLAIRKRQGTVMVLVDRSRSMPDDTVDRALETIGLLGREMPEAGRLGVIAFGSSSVMEKAPDGNPFGGFNKQVSSDGSDLEKALSLAISLIPDGAPGRLLVVSDGRWTGKSPENTAVAAAARGIAVDYRFHATPRGNDVAISKIDAPETVSPGQGFAIHAWVTAPSPQTVSYELRRENALLARGDKELTAGANRLFFRDLAGEPGTRAYALRIGVPENDPVPQNNEASFLVGVSGAKPILVVQSNPDSSLVDLLENAGVPAVVGQPEVTWDLGRISNYAALILENTAAQELGDAAMSLIADWVTETGGGLMITGGRNAYAPGGYYGSPLDPILPVTMELRQEHRKFSLAMIVAMDRSGSMSVPTPDGRTKMDLANLAAAKVLDLLAPTDELGVVAVDSSAHVIVPRTPVSSKSEIRNKILRIQSMGGGIFVYEALTTAVRMLLGSDAGARHVLLFADAADAEQPGAFRELLEKCGQNGISVSVVGLGTDSDSDAALLAEIAALGKGQVYFTDHASALPRIFAQDTFAVARASFVEEPTPVRFTNGILSLSPIPFADPPQLGGYNLCYAKEHATVALISEDEYEAPIVAFQHAGNGRVLCYTGEADGRFTGPIGAWPEVGAFFSSLARWTAAEDRELPGGSAVTQTLRNGLLTVTLHLDPERERDPFSEPPRVNVLRGEPGQAPRRDSHAMKWTDADRLTAEIRLQGEEIALAAATLGEGATLQLAPVRLPYSPEYLPEEPGKGRPALARIARIGGGEERTQLSRIWQELPKKETAFSLRAWLLFLAMSVLLAEILERRTGVLSLGLARGSKSQRVKKITQPRAEPIPPVKTEAPTSKKTEKEREVAETGMGGALRKAKQRAEARTKPGNRS